MNAARLLVLFAGLAGLSGVALAAMSAHVTGGDTATIAANFLLFHAATLLGLAALIAQGVIHSRIAGLAGIALVIGTSLFCGDLALRALYGIRLGPLVAPAGGIALMAGWALVALAALRRR
jgi:uncharacterized membrane protein YgdD (TMEM256/DUF423 family)